MPVLRSEYILHLINRHQQQMTELETILLEGINSGPPIDVTESWWEEKRSMLVKKNSATKTDDTKTTSPIIIRPHQLNNY
ncbi:MAG: hypothetical protein SXA11_17575 [Cyanobacteriota bacterium]|nr:hypothetical protein [Cyanobacteriota bacterium]